MAPAILQDTPAAEADAPPPLMSERRVTVRPGPLVADRVPVVAFRARSPPWRVAELPLRSLRLRNPSAVFSPARGGGGYNGADPPGPPFI